MSFAVFCDNPPLVRTVRCLDLPRRGPWGAAEAAAERPMEGGEIGIAAGFGDVLDPVPSAMQQCERPLHPDILDHAAERGARPREQPLEAPDGEPEPAGHNGNLRAAPREGEVDLHAHAVAADACPRNRVPGAAVVPFAQGENADGDARQKGHPRAIPGHERLGEGAERLAQERRPLRVHQTGAVGDPRHGIRRTRTAS